MAQQTDTAQTPYVHTDDSNCLPHQAGRKSRLHLCMGLSFGGYGNNKMRQKHYCSLIE